MVSRWQNGSSGFFNFLDDVKPVVRSSKGGFIPFVPGPRERAEIVKALDGDYATVVISWPRRHGKTLTSSMIVLWRFLSRRTENIAMVANSEKQTIDTAFRAVRDAFDNTPMLKALASAGTVEVGVDAVRFPATGSVIQAYSSNPAALWGKKLTAAQLSELHASKGSAVLEVLTGSLLDSEGSMMLIDSTVGPMSSPLYALYEAHIAGDDPSLFFSHIQYADLDDACANGPSWIDPVKLRAASRRMLPQTFNLMHLNRWGDASGLLIDSETLSKCTEVIHALARPVPYSSVSWRAGRCCVCGLDDSSPNSHTGALRPAPCRESRTLKKPLHGPEIGLPVDFSASQRLAEAQSRKPIRYSTHLRAVRSCQTNNRRGQVEVRKAEEIGPGDGLFGGNNAGEVLDAHPSPHEVIFL